MGTKKISISMTVKEIVSLCMMLKVGKLFTRPEERVHVEKVLNKIATNLHKNGVPETDIERLIKL